MNARQLIESIVETAEGKLQVGSSVRALRKGATDDLFGGDQRLPFFINKGDVGKVVSSSGRMHRVKFPNGTIALDDLDVSQYFEVESIARAVR